MFKTVQFKIEIAEVLMNIDNKWFKLITSCDIKIALRWLFLNLCIYRYI